MSEQTEARQKALSDIEILENDDFCFGDFEDYFKGKESKNLEAVFLPLQMRVIKVIVKKFGEYLDFHNGRDSNAHEDIKEEIVELRREFRNHRHGENLFSDKPVIDE